MEEGYLRKIPVDPMTGQRTGRPCSPEPDPDNPGETPGIYDVKSASTASSLERDALQRMVRRPAGSAGGLLALVALALVRLRLRGPRSAYRQGQKEAKKGNWDLAVARLTKALQKTRQHRYKIALENARVQASRFHYDGGAQGPGGPGPRQGRGRARDRDQVRPRQQVGRRRAAHRAGQDPQAGGGEAAARRFRGHEGAQPGRSACPCPCSPRGARVPITLKFTRPRLQKILETLGKLAGVNILFDEGFRDKKST